MATSAMILLMLFWRIELIFKDPLPTTYAPKYMQMAGFLWKNNGRFIPLALWLVARRLLADD